MRNFGEKICTTNAVPFRLTICAALVGALAACGGGSSGDGNSTSSGGSTSTSGAQLAGKAIDGYLSGATVCLDNGQGACDTSMPSATTDANGNYSIPYSTDIKGRKLIVTVSATTKDASRPGYAFPASFQLTGVVNDPTSATNITPISAMVGAMEETGLSQQQAIAQVSNLLGKPVDLSADYIASGDTTSQTFATQVVNEITANAINGNTSASTTRALLQAMVVNNTLTPSQAQVATQLSQPDYALANASAVLANPAYTLDGYLYDWVNGEKPGTNQQAPVQSVIQLSDGVLGIAEQEFVNSAWSPPRAYKYDQMIGAYELKGDASGFTPYLTLAQYNSLPVSSNEASLTGTDANTGIDFTYEYRSVDLSNQPLSTAVPLNGEAAFPLWVSNTMTATNFAAGTKAYAGLLSFATERVVIPVWQPTCTSPTVTSGMTCGGAPAVMDGSHVVEVSSPTATSYSSVQQAIGMTMLSPGGGFYFQMLANGTVQRVQPTGSGDAVTVVNTNVGSWATYARNSNVIVVTFNATTMAVLKSAAASQSQAQVDPQTVPILSGASTVVALVNNNLMTGWLFPTTYAEKSIQFGSGLPKPLMDAVTAAASAYGF